MGVLGAYKLYIYRLVRKNLSLSISSDAKEQKRAHPSYRPHLNVMTIAGGSYFFYKSRRLRDFGGW